MLAGLQFFPIYTPTDVLIFTTAAGEKTWGVDADGQASLASNWFGGVAPTGTNEAVALSTIITADRTIQVDVPLSLRQLRFDDDNSYTVAGPQSITFAKSGSRPGGHPCRESSRQRRPYDQRTCSAGRQPFDRPAK